MTSRRVVLNVGVADGAEVGRVELVGSTVGSNVVLSLVLDGKAGGCALLRGALVGGTEETSAVLGNGHKWRRRQRGAMWHRG
jgi:hypothetical protein